MSHSDGNSSSEDEFAAVVCHECGCNSEICILEKEVSGRGLCHVEVLYFVLITNFGNVYSTYKLH